MKRVIPWSLSLVLLLAPALSAQERDHAANGRKQATAARIADGAMHVDGRLDEEVWQRAAPITDFVQKEPIEGAPPTEKMEVRFVYDDDTIYVWGLNLVRFTPTLNEVDYWVLVPRTQRGWASHFGDLRGIQGIRRTRRVELLPYIAGASTMNASCDRGNPFDVGAT